MEEAGRAYVEVDDLQAAACRIIARHTGAAAGIVTSGAAAGLTLGAAACLAGLDPERMDRLPDISGIPRSEIIYPKPGPYDYDHPVRLSGARLAEVDYSAPSALARIRSAIGPRTAAVGFVWHQVEERPPVGDVARLAHENGLPLLVDAAMSLPPVDYLRKFIGDGADLVVFSGGKHLGGPQASGILCGREDLVRSAWLQMIDLDVRPDTWPLAGWIARPPRHGIGRSMKVGKEAVAGLLTALELYSRRDHAAELATWRRRAEEIGKGLSDVAGLRVAVLFPSPNGQPFPAVRLDAVGFPMKSLHAALRRRRPKVILREDETDAN